MNNSILMLAALGLGAYMVLSKKSAPAAPTQPDVTSFGDEVGRQVLDAFKSAQGKNTDYSYDPVSGQKVLSCPSNSRQWNTKLQRWECTALSPGKDEEAEVRF